ncbi:MAG: hypothetical protein KKC37_09325 [Proteobacteria bacterium]|nr:hypothetical protein [Pseudomonadota bacterium]
MCQPAGAPRQMTGCGCAGRGLIRRFYSKAEQQERLETYAEKLRQELAGVRERIDELES